VKLTTDEKARIARAIRAVTEGDPAARFEGMVDTRVRDEDFECDPDRPDSSSCPSGGCQHCRKE